MNMNAASTIPQSIMMRIIKNGYTGAKLRKTKLRGVFRLMNISERNLGFLGCLIR